MATSPPVFGPAAPLLAGRHTMGKKSQQPLPVALVTDESGNPPGDHVDENNLARTRAPGFHAELEALHRKYAKLEKRLEKSEAHNAELELENAKLRDQNAALGRHLKRRTGVLGSVLVTVEAKAVVGMATLPMDDNWWWTNAAQALVGLAVGGYLIWPNVRNLIRMSSDTADDAK